MEARGNRDQMVIATKFTTRYLFFSFHAFAACCLTGPVCSYKAYAMGKNAARNQVGNHKKSLYLSVEDSLKKLKTSYVGRVCTNCYEMPTHALSCKYRSISYTCTG
jgi:aryl-alcohol dehydrogenase-like predicted oxidoreductase